MTDIVAFLTELITIITQIFDAISSLLFSLGINSNL